MTSAEEAARIKIKKRIRGFVLTRFLIGAENRNLGDDDSFLEQGIIDSTGIMELVEFVQDAFGVKVQDEELVPDNLDSLNKLAKFVHSKKDKAGS